MTSNHNWLRPTRNKFWNVLANDWLTENDTIQNVANSAVGRLPHLLQVEFFYTGFIWCDCCAFHANTVLQNGMCRVNRYLIVRCVTIFDAQVVVLKIDVEIRQDESVLNELPHDASHFVAIEFDDWVYDFDFGCHC